MDYEMEQTKFLESGAEHRWWKRNWAVYRMKHVQNRDDRFPRPLENHTFSLIETVRPVWADNVPDVQIVAMRPGLEEQERQLNMVWKWIAQTGAFDTFWESLYDYLPQTGVRGGKVLWDFTAPGGGKPVFSPVDPRALAADPMSAINHRNAQVIRIKHRVDVGELKSMFPEDADKIDAVATTESRNRSGGMSDLAKGYDTNVELGTFGASISDRTAEVVEMWIKPDQDIIPFSETQLNTDEEGDVEAEAVFANEEPWIVYTYIPGAKIIDREIALNGLQVATGQAWRNPDSIYGISDVEMVVGMQIAMDQLNIRGHAHRLAVFSPPLILPKDSGVQRRHVAGRAAPIWEPATGELGNPIRWIDVPAPNREALNYLAERPQFMRRILGIDELTTDVLNRQQTATAVAEVREALESRTRQKIRNFNNLVVDLARAALSLTLQNMPLSIFMRQESEFEQVDVPAMEQIDLSQFSVKLATDKSGPLTKLGRLNSMRQLIEFGTFDPQISLPSAVREVLIDNSSAPRAEELKQHVREIEAKRQQQEAQLEAQAQQQAALEQEALAQQVQGQAQAQAQAEAPVEGGGEDLTGEELAELLSQ